MIDNIYLLRGESMKIKILTTLTLFIFICSINIASAYDVYNQYLQSTSSSIFITQQYQYYNWEQYPYCPTGTSISFPADEGKHNPSLTYPGEFWYISSHLTGCTTGKDYGAFVAFFKHPQMLLFSISDLNQEKIYSDAKFGILNAAEGELNLTFNTLLNKDYIHTKRINGELVPFQYKLIVNGVDREQNNQEMKMDFDMHCTKPPMTIGEDGLVDIGNGWSYYYSQTKICVSGSITVDGTTENINGFAWIDHQWGNFNLLPSERVSWEWFSIQLDDYSEIMVGDIWWQTNGEKCGSYSDGLNLLNANNIQELQEDYTITQLDFWTDPVSGRKFASKWQLTEPTKPINLTIEADFNNQMVPVFGNPSIMKIVTQLFFNSCFWEGSCSVSGTIGGIPVTGKAYAELTHPWNNNNIQESQSNPTSNPQSNPSPQSQPISQPSSQAVSTTTQSTTIFTTLLGKTASR